MTGAIHPLAALDIGGANLKAARSDGASFSLPFEVWRAPAGLAGALAEVLRRLSPFEHLAVTTTAELCDCFETKRQGVLAILEAVEKAVGEAAPRPAISVWRTDGRFAPLEAARADPLPAAAANWLALATYAGRLAPRGEALLADLGSTTLDLIPLLDGRPEPRGRTDSERLIAGELVYTGARRTPVFAVARELPYRGASCPAIPELFATMADVYVLLGDLPEEPENRRTADGRPLTRERCLERLARVIGADRESFTAAEALAAAREAARAQLRKISAALQKLEALRGRPPGAAVISGEGEFVLRRALASAWPRCERISLEERLGPEGSRAACACSLLHLLAASISHSRQSPH
ncbi:MAG: H4MPT-linked C1 transfer pathway protein [Planctomycetes bacterium]|nr:H4MPT-linked C1 transfer pathway protein [Planctomycetota bacterium]